MNLKITCAVLIAMGVLTRLADGMCRGCCASAPKIPASVTCKPHDTAVPKTIWTREKETIDDYRSPGGVINRPIYPGDRVIMKCKYGLHSEYTTYFTTCQKDGTWHPYNIVCHRQPCKPLNNETIIAEKYVPRNTASTIKPEGGIIDHPVFAGDKVFVRCRYGSWSDKSERWISCNKDFFWVPEHYCRSAEAESNVTPSIDVAATTILKDTEEVRPAPYCSSFSNCAGFCMPAGTEFCNGNKCACAGHGKPPCIYRRDKTGC